MASIQPPSSPALRRSLLFTRTDLLTPYLSRHPTASATDLELALKNIMRFGDFKETECGSGIYEIFAPKNFSSLFWRVKNLEEEIRRDGGGGYRGKFMMDEEELAEGYREGYGS
jgi:hypothetical protein